MLGTNDLGYFRRAVGIFERELHSFFEVYAFPTVVKQAAPTAPNSERSSMIGRMEFSQRIRTESEGIHNQHASNRCRYCTLSSAKVALRCENRTSSFAHRTLATKSDVKFWEKSIEFWDLFK